MITVLENLDVENEDYDWTNKREEAWDVVHQPMR
jgi:hypothetical protein